VTTAAGTENVARVAAAFGLAFQHILPWEPPGSPNRALYRCVVETGDGPVILSQIAPNMVPRKCEIANLVASLHAGGVGQAVPYLEAVEGGHVVYIDRGWWLAQRWLHSEPLPRPSWVHDAARGEALACFLLCLRQVTLEWRWPGQSVFRLETWLRGLVMQLRLHDRAVLARIRDPLRLAQGALLNEANLPVTWAHGDLHPLNVLWLGTQVQAVIDWEFTGPKAAPYDLANLLGCVGVEQPSALAGEFALALVRRLRAAHYLPATAWDALPAYVLALRLAWLSEWLRNGDSEMVALECDYLTLLLSWQQALAEVWAR